MVDGPAVEPQLGPDVSEGGGAPSGSAAGTAAPVPSDGASAGSELGVGSQSPGAKGIRRRRGKPVATTKVSTAWVAVVGALVALVVVLVFILENQHTVRATFFGAQWQVPLGVDLLLAAVLGGLLVVMVGAVRMVQLRREARRRGDPVR